MMFLQGQVLDHGRGWGGFQGELAVGAMAARMGAGVGRDGLALTVEGGGITLRL